MSFSPLPLSYCTNVHPGKTVAEVEAGLDRYTVRVAARLASTGCRLAPGLWLANSVVKELLANDDLRRRFRAGLVARGLACHTLNAFPFGDFHNERVKEDVYRPGWTEKSRLEYTLSAARILADLLSEGVDGSISSLPLGFAGIEGSAEPPASCVENLVEAAVALSRLQKHTGRCIRLALEPEPCCWLDETPSAIGFFRDRLWPRAAMCDALEAVRTHIGLCFDVCHQSVAFEDMAGAISEIDAAGIRINKIHITCAIELEEPAHNVEGRRALATYVEPRYLHQTKARTADGRIVRRLDLDTSLALEPPDDFVRAERWRVHYHVPVDAETLGPLKTTRSDLRKALAAVHGLSYAPHLEVETYTWELLPQIGKPDLVEGLVREMTATRSLLDSLTGSSRTR